MRLILPLGVWICYGPALGGRIFVNKTMGNVFSHENSSRISYTEGSHLIYIEMTLEPRGYRPLIGQTPLQTNQSTAVILLITSITYPTTASATSSKCTLPALHTEIPLRRHSSRSMWLTPALEECDLRKVAE